MKRLEREETRAIAELARLELSAEEEESLSADLAQILEHMDALAEVDTRDVDPLTHPVPMPLKTRADQIESSLAPERAVGAAPDREGDYLRVPRVIETRGGEGAG